jgi:hypothetical protein
MCSLSGHDERDWVVDPAPADSPPASALLREYYIDVADRYRMIHLGRRSTQAELSEELAAYSSDDLVPPRGPRTADRAGHPVGLG